MKYETNIANNLTGGIKKSLIALATLSQAFIAVPSRAEEKSDTRMVIVQKPDGELRIELQQIWEKRGESAPQSQPQSSVKDTALLNAFVRDLQACRETPDKPECERVNQSGTEEVLRSPELYGMYVGMLAGAFAAGFCAVRPEDCIDPFLP